MKKAKKVQYGIEITKPWSKEMYDHNEEVKDTITATVLEMWQKAYNEAEEEFESYLEEDQIGLEFSESDWNNANDEMIEIQKAITYYSFGNGEIADIEEEIKNELEILAFHRLPELVEDLELKLEKEIIGFKS